MRLNKIGIFQDPDGTRKHVFKDEIGIIEIGEIVNREDRDVLCVPSMYSCGLGCRFCHLTTMKIRGVNEPISGDTLYDAAQLILSEKPKKPNLIWCIMGVGDPLLNDELVAELQCKRHLLPQYETVGYAISTIFPGDGIIPSLGRLLQQDTPTKVHFSMHSPIDRKRHWLVPGSTLPVQTLLSFLSQYREQVMRDPVQAEHIRNFHKSGSPVEIHYTLIEGKNDSNQELDLLAYYLNRYEIPIKFIQFNETGSLKRSSREQEFVETLQRVAPHVRVKLHKPPGVSIGSSCGEFTRHFYHEPRNKREQLEFDEYRRKFEIPI